MVRITQEPWSKLLHHPVLGLNHHCLPNHWRCHQHAWLLQPFVSGGSVVFAIGSGLLYILRVDDSAGTWIGYQLVAGIGAGACIQIPFLSVQVVLSAKDMPKGIALITFFNAMGGIVASPITSIIFSSNLLQQLEARVPLLNAAVFVAEGPRNVEAVTPPRFLVSVFEAYDKALSQTFILPVVAACLAILCSLAFEWKSMKGKKLEVGEGAQ